MTTGIVAEYDPFHKGHLYQLQKARELTGADNIVIVLGGDFLQRGTPSMTDKRRRARMALEAGADLVLSLPYIYSVNSAREYACGAVNILEGTGCVDHISFGCETGDPALLDDAVSVTVRDRELSPLIRKYLDQGISYPESFTRSVEELGGAEAACTLRRPNNLLACEYIRAVRVIGSSMIPVPVQRIERDDPGDHQLMQYASASTIRSRIREQGVAAVNEMVPPSTAGLLREVFADSTPSDVFGRMDRRILSLLRYRILTTDGRELRKIYSVGEGIENRLKTAAADELVSTVSDMADRVKTRRYTRARIMRMLTHILMGFQGDDFKWLRGCCCARVLAFNARGRQLLARMRKTATIPVLSNLSRIDRYDARVRRILELDIRAAGLYEMLRGGSDPTGGEISYVPYRQDSSGSIS